MKTEEKTDKMPSMIEEWENEGVRRQKCARAAKACGYVLCSQLKGSWYMRHRDGPHAMHVACANEEDAWLKLAPDFSGNEYASALLLDEADRREWDYHERKITSGNIGVRYGTSFGVAGIGSFPWGAPPD